MRIKKERIVMKQEFYWAHLQCTVSGYCMKRSPIAIITLFPKQS